MARNQQDMTAIIYDRRGRVLAIGKNSYVKTHPLQAHYAKKVGRDKKQFIHAEIHALAQCRDLTEAYRIVIMRFYKDGSPAPAAPCPICAEAIRDLTNIKIIEHT